MIANQALYTERDRAQGRAVPRRVHDLGPGSTLSLRDLLVNTPAIPHARENLFHVKPMTYARRRGPRQNDRLIVIQKQGGSVVPQSHLIVMKCITRFARRRIYVRDCKRRQGGGGGGSSSENKPHVMQGSHERKPSKESALNKASVTPYHAIRHATPRLPSR